MRDDAALLTALQHADSFFPSGASAFSWGLEALCADGAVRSAEDVARFLKGQIRQRWASCDRPFLVAAHRSAGDLDAVIALDEKLVAMALPRTLREGASRAGAALLAVHERLETRGAAAYRRALRAGRAPGQLPVVQGLVWSGVGLDERAACAVAGHGLSVSIVSAALRLGVVSHVDAQRALLAIRPILAEILAAPVPGIDEAYVGAPAADIAAMRHEALGLRLFAN